MMSAELCELAGITYRQLDFWERRGHVHALKRRKGKDTSPVPKRAGSGFDREWPDAEVVVTVNMARLVRAGFAPAIAADIARAYPNGHRIDLDSGMYLVIDMWEIPASSNGESP